MTDQTIPADEVRKIIEFYRDGARGSRGRILDALGALLPPPKRPTLADMTAEERRACQWMQCDVAGGFPDRGVIIDPLWTGRTGRVIWPDGDTDNEAADRVTPRPDLPRMTWPGNVPAPVPIDQEDYPPRDQLTLGGKWADITKLEEALRQKGEAADHAIVLDDEGDAHVWEARGGGGWIVRIPIQQCGPFRVILNDQGADQ